MATQTLNALADLTYEEIYEGYANGKSRLPKILRDIVAGSNAWATLAGSTGVPILRRRTGGGNATNVTGIGITNSTRVATLISTARYAALLAGYNGPDPYDTPPSQNFIDIDVRGLTKNPFDLIDMVAGVNYAVQTKGSGDKGATREVKVSERGSASVIRDITQVIDDVTVDFDVRTLYNDRIGDGGESGAVHGVDQGIVGLIEAASEAVIAATGYAASYDLTSDDEMVGQIDNSGGGTAQFIAGVNTVDQVLSQLNTTLKPHSGKRDVAYFEGDTLKIRSQNVVGTVEVDITEACSPLDLEIENVVGATLGGATLSATGQEIIELTTGSIDRLTNIRYGTYQFGTVRVYNSINDASPVAYILHPDLFDDMVTWN